MLQDSGNLVLLDSSSKIIWQSFDSPTDTILPGQVLPMGTKLYSNANGSIDYSTGQYRLEIQMDGNLVLSAFRFGGRGYWNSVTLGNQNVSLIFNQSTAFMYVVNDTRIIYSMNRTEVLTTIEDYYHRATISDRGNLQQWIYNKRGGNQWTLVWRAITEPCIVNSICGAFGFCTSPVMQQAKTIRQTKVWISWSGGIDSKTKELHRVTEELLQVDEGTQVEDMILVDWVLCCVKAGNLRSIVSHDLEVLGDFKRINDNIRGLNLISLPSIGNGLECGGHTPLDPDNVSKGCHPETVMNYCLENFGGNYIVEVVEDAGFPSDLTADLARANSTCRKKRTPLVNAKKSVSTKGIKALIKVPIKVPINPDISKPTRKKKFNSRAFLEIGSIISAILAFLLAVATIYYNPAAQRFIKRKYFLTENTIVINFREFTFQELQEATNGFNKALGRGSSGKVYKGIIVLKDAQIEIAVKKLEKDVRQSNH
ncbi:hypothetical protein EZV62_000607 [Acer yangbiense]|uniref:Bulb-type lectin domain-containing protein n=1 Tax=Acer yangbiense TaxID=1000413 RepID=A0A5C7ISE2_9ROSI|nr:hypothetical protein EZV62_000607 [Acer yangbiense]